MRDELPPLDPRAIRVTIHLDGTNEQLRGDFVVSKLPKGLDSLSNASNVPMVRGTELGAAAARSILAVALEHKTYPAAVLAALWICLYGPRDAESQISLTMDDLREAAGSGVVAITVSDDGCRWDYRLKSRHIEYAAGRTVPLNPDGDAGGTIH